MSDRHECTSQFSPILWALLTTCLSPSLQVTAYSVQARQVESKGGQRSSQFGSERSALFGFQSEPN
ncbi:hypothetical protein WN943_003584 [Citrus x changshan-huyou]